MEKAPERFASAFLRRCRKKSIPAKDLQIAFEKFGDWISGVSGILARSGDGKIRFSALRIFRAITGTRKRKTRKRPRRSRQAKP